MNRENLFEIENGINIDDDFVLYVNNDLRNLTDVKDGDFCICNKKIYKFNGKRWVEMVDEDKVNSIIMRKCI